jgi:hypothetical protein
MQINPTANAHIEKSKPKYEAIAAATIDASKEKNIVYAAKYISETTAEPVNPKPAPLDIISISMPPLAETSNNFQLKTVCKPNARIAARIMFCVPENSSSVPAVSGTAKAVPTPVSAKKIEDQLQVQVVGILLMA